jgi:hypothetical protein
MKLKPIPRNGSNKLAYIFELIPTNSHYHELSNMLLGGLTATEISLVVHFLGIKEQFLYTHKYLSPLRDLDPSLSFFEPFIQKGCQILMLGHDIPDLVERIQFPAIYWSSWIAEALGGIIPPPKIWVVIIPPHRLQREMSVDLEGYNELFDPLIQLPDGKDIQRWAGMTSVNLQTYQPQRETQYSKYMFTGRAVGDNGRGVLDEVYFAFKFPFEH